MTPEKKNMICHPLISEETWLNHFYSLHSSKPLNPKQQTIVNELKELERREEQLCSLDYLITENEILIAAEKLKNNKSSFWDKE